MRLDDERAAFLAREHFGVDGRAEEMGGERTQNFRIRTATGQDWTLKVSDPAEGRELVDLESLALMHLELHAPEIGMPRVARAPSGDFAVPLGDGRYIRLFSFLRGRPFNTLSEPSQALRQSIGAGIARLDQALESFSHPVAVSRDLLWDPRRMDRTRGFMALMDPVRRPLAEAVMARIDRDLLPALGVLPQQAIHNDMNAQNILVDGANDHALGGFLDFGDLVRSARVIDLSGACAVQITEASIASGQWLRDVADVVRGYQLVQRLTSEEKALLIDFILLRSLINVCVTEKLASLDPANRTYIMKNNSASWMRLDLLCDLPGSTLVELLEMEGLN